MFDRSELNMFSESITIAKTIKEYLILTDQTKVFKSYLEHNLTVELSELYELASNTKLFICSPTLASIINLIKMRLNYTTADDIENNPTGKFCTATTALVNNVQLRIIDIIEEAFL